MKRQLSMLNFSESLEKYFWRCRCKKYKYPSLRKKGKIIRGSLFCYFYKRNNNSIKIFSRFVVCIIFFYINQRRCSNSIFLISWNYVKKGLFTYNFICIIYAHSYHNAVSAIKLPNSDNLLCFESICTLREIWYRITRQQNYFSYM